MDYDFGGWATKFNCQCSDGRIIRKDAFKDNDGKRVPLVWNHDHNEPSNVLGHAILENREEGVYAYCKFNNSDKAEYAKELIKHGDIDQLSIYANKLKQKGANVLHGAIREVSLVLAGANPQAFIETVMMHSDDGNDYETDEAVIYPGPESIIEHSSDDKETVEEKEDETLMNKKDNKDNKDNKDLTVQDVIESMTEEQKEVMYLLIGKALEDNEEDEGDEEMKQNVFDMDKEMPESVLTHSDEVAIVKDAKRMGSFKDAFESYVSASDHLSHGFDTDGGENDVSLLFPEFRDVTPGAPELITRDYGWVNKVMNGVHKSPISRIRTRQTDVRSEELRAMGYKKGSEKQNLPNVKLINRTTDPQTVFVKDKMNRDDIVDITDFDVVGYQYDIMRGLLKEEVARAILIGDGREDGDENKISPEHIRPIWTDDELYTIHAPIDLKAAKAELQGTNTSANFGENYIFTEAVVSAALYAREKYKGSGNLTMFCTPRMVNKMLLARDLNGRRIYSSKAELETALNVSSIETVEQMEGKVRTDKEQKKHNLLALFVNLDDYRVGSTKGGEITNFNQFDIDFNMEKYLIETRLSGALTRVFSAIALEEPQGE